ncbi:hypothetical protein HY029_02060 [Candidatus Gottesmanbacteria bacterium]|nr:hypothetical protein [Candidatus Gottesmanbacteria bacterium]
MNKKLFFLLLFLLTLPIVVFGQREIQQLMGFAAVKPANIIIETKNIIGPINNSWAAFSQGGEEAPPVLSPLIGKMKELSPKYIRLDHIYDSNNIVSKNGNEFVYNFSTLDKVVDDIISMGALPFFSLSYMPKDFTASGSIIDIPKDWNNWKDLVEATIQHYSGKNTRNLSNIYYEVWNEPELPQFGSWKFDSPKDYRLLYFYAAQAANETKNANKFYLGGPAVGSYYPNWINNFVSYVAQNNLRLDFYSWHRYTIKPSEYLSDAQKTRNILSSYPAYANMPLMLTEWGIDSQNSDINNTNIAAAYAIYSVSQFNKMINLAFNFEVKDGPPPTGGKWGLMYHERDPDKPLFSKPKYKAFAQLAQLSGNQLLLSGDGTYVSGLATSISSSDTTAILANYDISSRNIENVPVTFTGLSPAVYNLKYNYPLDNRTGFYEIPTTSGNISKNFLMPANSIVYLELTRVSQLATYINGPSIQSYDKALILNNIGGPLSFSTPEFHLLPTGSINFDLKPLWDKSGHGSFFILEAPFEITEGLIDKLSLSKQNYNNENLLVFSISQQNQPSTLSIPIDNWDWNSWHHVELGWNQNGFWITVDNQLLQKSISLDIRNGKILTFSPIEAALDNLKIIVGKDQIIERHFDGNVNN